jgi:hypothetical protein
MAERLDEVWRHKTGLAARLDHAADYSENVSVKPLPQALATQHRRAVHQYQTAGGRVAELVE